MLENNVVTWFGLALAWCLQGLLLALGITQSLFREIAAIIASVGKTMDDLHGKIL
jgi:hypothetical protein